MLANLNALTLTKAKTENVPVPAELLDAVIGQPEEFGLSSESSRRQRLGELLLLGARAAAAHRAELAEEEYYLRLAQDSERQAVAEQVMAETRSEGVL